MPAAAIEGRAKSASRVKSGRVKAMFADIVSGGGISLGKGTRIRKVLVLPGKTRQARTDLGGSIDREIPGKDSHRLPQPIQLKPRGDHRPNEVAVELGKHVPEEPGVGTQGKSG